MDEYIIEMNLMDDFETILKGKMEELGIKVNSKDDIIIQYLTATRKHVYSTPRQVLFSKEFVCPKEHKIGLDNIIELIEKGKNLSPYLSNKISDVQYNDGLLNDWGIHHLHLGKNIKGKKAQRTGSLLFAHFTKDRAYLINIFNHSEWTSDDIMKIISNNWKELLHPLQGISPDNISDKFHAKIRKVNGNVIRDFGDGVAYAPLGGGSMVSGVNFSDMLFRGEIERKIEWLEKEIRSGIEDLAKQYFQSTQKKLPKKLKFQLYSDDDTDEFFVCELSLHLRINLPQRWIY